MVPVIVEPCIPLGCVYPVFQTLTNMRFSSGIPFVLMTLESAQLINLFAVSMATHRKTISSSINGLCLRLFFTTTTAINLVLKGVDVST